MLLKAVGDAFQRAHKVLNKLSQGYELPTKLEERIKLIGMNGRSEVKVPKFNAQQEALANHGPTSKKLSLLFDDWWQEAAQRGIKKSTYLSYKSTFENFIKFLGFDDMLSVRSTHVIAFKNYRLNTPSSKTGKCPSVKTVKDSDLAALKAIFGWALSNEMIKINPAADVTIKLGKQAKLRSKGFTDQEARSLLKASIIYRNPRESKGTEAAKRWIPWLCAFTGARVGEIAQLRREDIRLEGDFWLIRITPEAGTQKTDEAREVVLHPQLIELGFAAFRNESPEGHLFIKKAQSGDVLGPLQGLKNRLAEFARKIVPDPNVMPNHGWRHRFKTIGRDAGIEMRVLDAIQGHAPRSVADKYGDISIKVIASAIYKLPSFDIT